jgi:cytoskeleton protein RodZ
MNYSYGEELKTARERSGLSLQAVADALHLDPRLIEAIEGEEQNSLPAPAYVRGYIRAYAQLVRCEPDTLIARYNTHAQSDPQLVASVHAVMASKQERDARLMWVGTGIVLSLLMIVIGGWLLIETLFIKPDNQVFEQPPAPSPPVDTATIPGSWPADSPLAGSPIDGTTEPVEDPLTGGTVETQTQAAAPASSGPASAPAVQPETPEPATQSIPAQAPVPEKPIVTNAQTGNDRLNLSFDGVSWAEVLDANGARLIYGLFDAGTRALSVKGQAPFEVTIGDANHVDISVNGQAFSSEPYMQRNNTARFKVESPAVSE